jgi:hypothetical protein
VQVVVTDLVRDELLVAAVPVAVELDVLVVRRERRLEARRELLFSWRNSAGLMNCAEPSTWFQPSTVFTSRFT